MIVVCSFMSGEHDLWLGMNAICFYILTFVKSFKSLDVR